MSQQERESAIQQKAAQQQQQRGLKQNQQEVASRQFDTSFFEQIRDADLETDVFDWLESEFPALFSGAQIVGQRGRHWEQQQEWLNRVKAIRYETEQTPGALLERHPSVRATMAGADAPEDINDPISTSEKRVLRNAMEVATTRQTLSVGARGLKSVTTATSETRTVRHDDGDDDGMVTKATGGLFG